MYVPGFGPRMKADGRRNRMRIDDLSKFDGHDLPLEKVKFTNSGVELVVTPYNEAAKVYERFRLVIDEAAELRVDVQGRLSSKDFASLEVARFDFRAAGDRLNGELGIVPGSAG